MRIRQRARRTDGSAYAWLLAAVVLLGAGVTGAHSASHDEDEHACPICLHAYTLSWTPDPPPLAEPPLWQPLALAPVADVAVATLVTSRSRGPPVTLL